MLRLSRPLPALRWLGARARAFATEVDATQTTSREEMKAANADAAPTVESWVHNTANVPQSIVELNADVFGQPLRRDILQRLVRWHLAAARGMSTAKTKGRGEVRGGGRKPRPQKGSGRARQGSIRSPINKGGGHAHAKVQRDFSFDLPRKVRKLGLKVALSARYQEGSLILLDQAVLERPKSKDMINVKNALRLTNALIVDGVEHNKNFELGCRNLPHVKFITSPSANVYDILKRPQLVLTLKAVEELQQRLLGLEDESPQEEVDEETEPPQEQQQQDNVPNAA